MRTAEVETVPNGCRPIIIVMAKAPRAGEVKTRLMPALSGAEAASLAGCFAVDAVCNALSIGRDVMIAYSQEDGREVLKALLPGGLQWVAQQGIDLGARMDAALYHARACGYGPLIMIGTDSPTLPYPFVRQAVGALQAGEIDLALGPAEDGGYYLIGLRRPIPGLLQNIAWSTDRVYAQTVDNDLRLGLRVLSLPPWYDVDTVEDLLRLKRELSVDPEARFRAPRTYLWLLEKWKLGN